jgi:type I restriction enzyme, S subunit
MEATEILKKKKLLAPKLRFKGFNSEWIYKSFAEMTQFINGKAYKQVELLNEGKYKVLRVGNLFSKSDWYYSDLELDENKYVDNGDLMYAWSASFGPHFWLGPKTIYHYHIWKVIPSKNSDKQFLYYTFQVDLEKIKSQSQGGTMFHITKGNIEQRKFCFPTYPEQQKIASFLSVVDEKIQQLTRKKELLEQYKKGVMQQLFSGILRFKDENGKAFPKWEEKLLGEMAERNSTKNRSNNVNFVLTNSATQGIVSQDEYFDREIANQNNLEGYYIVAVDDFVYNPRISVHAPVGPIKRNKLKEGVMSPLYSIFRFKEKNLEYFEYYFETKGWHTYLESVSNMGARHDRMNIANSDFFKMPIPFPSSEERNKITEFLNGLSLKIELANKALTQTQTFKKGLLQQMFV